MTLGSVVAFVGYLALAYRPIMSMGQLLGNVAGSLSAAERIFAVLDAVPEVAELPDARELPGTCCDIRFADVSFAYEERRTVFSCSFSVGSGEWVAFVGRSGAGKSTLANLLCRLHDVTEGAVTIGGMDIRGIRISDLRRRIGLVSQEAYLIDGTIADNIAYGKPSAAREEILAAARSACAHDFIVQKPEGYDTPVGEGGALLSGGEKQRIAIARAILLDPAVIIFDEATSAVDIRTENEIFASMERLFRKRTFVCIAHRLSSPRRFNRIYVMENGRIAESGTHEELMAKKSLYHDHMIREPTQTSDTVM
jgi:ATP-binding cassette subfamily B protein